MVSFGDTLLAAVQGVVRVLLVVVTGAIIQTQGILPSSLRLGLSQLVFRLFLPCLLFTSIAKALSISSLASLAGVFAFAVGAHFTGAAVGWLSHAAFEKLAPKKHRSPVLQAPLFAACVALGNHGYLPLSLLPTVLGLLPFGSHRDAEADSADAVAITAMYIMCLNVLSWTFVHGLIKRQKRDSLAALGLQVAPEPPKVQQSPPSQPLASRALACVRQVLNPPLIACMSGIIVGLAAPLKAVIFAEIDDDAPCEDDEPSAPLQPTLTGALLSLAGCTVPIVLLQLGATMTDMYTTGRKQRRASQGSGESSGAAPGTAAVPSGGGSPRSADCSAEKGDEMAAQTAMPASPEGPAPVHDVAAAAARPEEQPAPAAAGAAEAEDGEPPIEASASSDTIHAPSLSGASSAVLQGTATGSGAVAAPAGTAHSALQVHSSASDGGGEGAVAGTDTAATPVVQHIVTAAVGAAKGPGVDVSLATISWPLLASVLCARLVIMPALGTALVYGLVLGGVLPSDDPVLVFVVMMQFTPPPAMNLALIAELEGFAQAAVGQVLFVGHLTAAVSMTAWISLQLAIVNSIMDTG